MCVYRSMLTSYHSVYLIRVSARAGRYATLPIATASAAAAAAALVFIRLLTMTLTVRRRPSQLRQASTLTSLAVVVLTSHSPRLVLHNRLLTFCTETHAFGLEQTSTSQLKTNYQNQML